MEAPNFGELNELCMVMDSNLNRASSAIRFNQRSSHDQVLDVSHQNDNVDSSDSLDASETTAQPCASPLLATASITLSLNAALAQKPFLNNLTSQNPANKALTSNLVSVAPPKNNDVSSVQSNSPIPVMSSSNAQAKLDYSTLSSSPLKVTPKSASAFPDLLRLPSKGNSFSNPASCPGARKTAIVWFRSDLRIHDNEALVSANNDSLSVLPVYCFDPRDYGKSSSGFDKTGPYRAKFLLECVSDLRANLRKRGSDLIVRVGKPEDVLVQLAKAVGADALYVHQEVTFEELKAESKVTAALKEEGIETRFFWGSTLYHLEDLPFALESMPSNYGGFRESVQNVKIRATTSAPEQLKGLPSRGRVKTGDIPTLQQLGLSPASVRQDGSNISGSSLEGGETEALKRLEHFVMEARNQSSSVSKNGNNNNGDSLYGANFSCKISPWLAMGCLSPRKMYEDLSSASKFITKKYGSSRKSTNSPVPSPAMAATV